MAEASAFGMLYKRNGFSLAVTVSRVNSGYPVAKAFLDICGMRTEQQPF